MVTRAPLIGRRALMLGGGAALALPARAAGGDPVRLTYGVTAGTNDPAFLEAKSFAEELRQRSRGRLLIRPMALTSMGFDEVDCLRVLHQKVVDLSFISPAYAARDEPLMTMFMPQGALLSADDNLRILDVQLAIAREVLDRWNVEVVTRTSGQAFREMGVVAKTPIASLAALRGRKFRHFTSVGIEAFQALDVKAQAISASELYLALKLGVVDAAVYSATFIRRQSIYEAAPYYSPLSPFTIADPFVIAARRDVWRRLPDDLRRLMVAVGRVRYAGYLQRWKTAQEEAADFAWLEKAGLRMLPAFPLADRRAIQAALFRAWGQSAERLGPRATAIRRRILAALG